MIRCTIGKTKKKPLCGFSCKGANYEIKTVGCICGYEAFILLNIVFIGLKMNYWDKWDMVPDGKLCYFDSQARAQLINRLFDSEKKKEFGICWGGLNNLLNSPNEIRWLSGSFSVSLIAILQLHLGNSGRRYLSLLYGLHDKSSAKNPSHKSQVRSRASSVVVIETARQQRVTSSSAKVDKKEQCTRDSRKCSRPSSTSRVISAKAQERNTVLTRI